LVVQYTFYSHFDSYLKKLHAKKLYNNKMKKQMQH